MEVLVRWEWVVWILLSSALFALFLVGTYVLNANTLGVI
jgi:hypothetical protein